jgi:hypothetical protein
MCLPVSRQLCSVDVVIAYNSCHRWRLCHFFYRPIGVILAIVLENHSHIDAVAIPNLMSFDK